MTTLTDFQDAARDVMAEFGRAATWTQFATSYSEATGVATTTATSYSVTCTPPIEHVRAFRGGETGTAATAEAHIAAEDLGFVPRAGDLVAVGAERWTVVSVKVHTVQTTDVLYSCGVRAGGPS